MDMSGDRLVSARQALERQDWAEAHALLSDVRRTQPLAAEDLHGLTDAAWWLGRVTEYLALCEEVHQAYLHEGRAERAAVVAFEVGVAWFLRGEPVIGSGWVSRGRRLIEDRPEGEAHGFLLYLEAEELLDAGDVEGSLDPARRLQAMATTWDRPVFGSLGLMHEGIVEIRRGHPVAGLRMVDEAMLPVLAGRIEPEWAGNLYCRVISICHELGDVVRARRWTDVTERWCAGFTSAVMFAGICRVHRGQLLRLEGDWPGAEACVLRASVELAELDVEATAEAHYELGELQRLRGELDAAEASFAVARRLGRDPEPGLALLRLAQGSAAEAASLIRRDLGTCADPLRRARLLAAAVEICCAVGDDPGAEQAAAELATIAEIYPAGVFRAWARTACGLVASHGGEPERALTALTEALECFAAIGTPYDVATVRALIGRAHADLGDSEAGRPHLAAARESFAALGAVPRLAWLESLGQRAEIPAGLTARELEIVRAVAEGLSNRQVAARLVISEKTVARHLANVYLKVGLNSRTAVAAWAHSEHLVDS